MIVAEVVVTCWTQNTDAKRSGSRPSLSLPQLAAQGLRLELVRVSPLEVILQCEDCERLPHLLLDLSNKSILYYV